MTTMHTATCAPAGTRRRLRGRPAFAWLAYAFAAGLGLTALAVLYLLDPRNPGTYPICPFFGLTGYHCPSCGTLRAVHQLLHGNFGAAVGYNAYAVAALPVLAYGLAVGWLRSVGWPAPHPTSLAARWIWTLLGAVLVFWLLRNVPVAPFTALAP